MDPRPPFRLSVLISGGGGLMVRLIRAASGDRAFAVSQVLSSSADAPGNEKARQLGVSAVVLPRRGAGSAEEYSRQVWDAIEHPNAPDGVIMLGWLQKLDIPERWRDRVVNVHPSLLPAFGGKGMWGHHVHQAVIDSGAKVSGCTYHFADNEYDHGPILFQAAVPVLDEDTVESLEARVVESQHRTLVPFVEAWAEGRYRKAGNRFCGGPLPQWIES